LFQRRVCLCAVVPRVETRTHVVIIRHHTERFRSSNSGRLAHLALPNSALYDHGGAAGPAVLPVFANAWLVFPEGEPVREITEPPGQLVVLDATWSQARRMFRKIDALRGLPIMRLPAPAITTARMRESPAPDRVSTIEAIAHALRYLEGNAVAEPLEALFRIAVERSAASGRNIPTSV
jgi:DTW domain-containing protein YfiP